MCDKETRTILLVEDSKDDAELALVALSESNIRNPIVHAKDGAEALNYLFRRGRFTDRPTNAMPLLVLLDLKLPKVDGLEVLQRVRESNELKTIPIVILTSSKEEEDMARSYGLGANSYIQKPVDFTKFSEAVKQLSLYWLVLNECPPLPNGGV